MLAIERVLLPMTTTLNRLVDSFTTATIADVLIVRRCQTEYDVAQEKYKGVLASFDLPRDLERRLVPVTKATVLESLARMEKEAVKGERDCQEAMFLLILQEVKTKVPATEALALFNNADRAAAYLILDEIIRNMATFQEAWFGRMLISWMIEQNLLGEGSCLESCFSSAEGKLRPLFQQRRFNRAAATIKHFYAECLAKAILWRLDIVGGAEVSAKKGKLELIELFKHSPSQATLTESHLLDDLSDKQIALIKRFPCKELTPIAFLKAFNLQGFHYSYTEQLRVTLEQSGFATDGVASYFASSLDPGAGKWSASASLFSSFYGMALDDGAPKKSAGHLLPVEDDGGLELSPHVRSGSGASDGTLAGDETFVLEPGSPL